MCGGGGELVREGREEEDDRVRGEMRGEEADSFVCLVLREGFGLALYREEDGREKRCLWVWFKSE